MTATEADPAAEAAWERSRIDPGFRARFLRAYRGRRDPDDALWWFAHPDRDAADGRPAPRAEVDRLHRDLYSDGAGPDAATAYLEAAEEVAREDALTAHAVLAAQTSVAREHLRPALMRAPLLLVAALCIAGGVAAGVLAARPSTAPAVGSSPTASPIAAPVPVPRPTALGRTLLRLSDRSPSTGPQPSSGVLAYSSGSVSASGRVLLTVSCRGGYDLYVALNGNEAPGAGSVVVDCPATEVATVRSLIAQTTEVKPFRVVVYQSRATAWQLLLSSYPDG